MKWNTPLIVAGLVVSAAVFIALTLHHDANPQAATIGFVTAVIALLTQAQKTSPAAADTTTTGEAPRGRGVSPIVAPDDAALKLKKDLLTRWAAEGQPIDDATEVKAEITAQDVIERSNAWRKYPDVAPAAPPPTPSPVNPPTAAVQSVEPSEKKT